MLIRRNPVKSAREDDESHQSCARLAVQSIEAMTAYSHACPRNRAAGYFLSTALVECICHLLYILQDRGEPPAVDRASLISSVREAHTRLCELSETCMTAKRAVNVLCETISVGGEESAEQRPPIPNGSITQQSKNATQTTTTAIQRGNTIEGTNLISMPFEYPTQELPDPVVDFSGATENIYDFGTSVLMEKDLLSSGSQLQQDHRSGEDQGPLDLIGNFRNDLSEMDLDSVLEIWPQDY